MEIIREHGRTKEKAVVLANDFLDTLMKRRFFWGAAVKEISRQKNGDLMTFVFRKEKRKLSGTKKPRFSFFSWLRGQPVIYGVITVGQKLTRFTFQTAGFEKNKALENEIAGLFEEFFPEKKEISFLKTGELGPEKRRRQ